MSPSKTAVPISNVDFMNVANFSFVVIIVYIPFLCAISVQYDYLWNCFQYDKFG